ncbi:MAG TPA: hypothetical protein VKF59_00665 [Candidatus Dormibacteraeota bacterium]|nr:hypothetical protein [Candidatus Dormibacteraeota bacterium]
MTRHLSRRRAAVLTLAALAYALAAWAVAPGFYDGFAPPSPYRWTSPPPQFRSNNQPPLSGKSTVRVGADGKVDPGSIFTQDGQAAISFVAGAFTVPPDRSPVTISIGLPAQFPDPGNLHLATNVYCITSTSPLAAGQEVLVTLQFSAQVPAPGDVYEYQGDGPWQKIGNTGSAQPFYIAARSTSLGCFAGAYPANAAQTAQGARLGGGQLLPIIVALAILVVVLAGVPLAILRRRGAEEDEGD